MMTTPTQEEIRLAEAQNHIAHWRRWGPYLSDRNLHKIVNSLGSVFICSSRQKYHPFKGSQEQPQVIERSL
ncbi:MULTISPECIES: hypothetical protein [unclassified Nostoc]|uniref:hypothetical protein n=1 Tax=unclassified Nostoc TaxID=2593658 RepID=UPI001180FC8E|nr:hypothetical protein [Nostoc sp. 'Peltigera membranacea cyanobiont' 210A]